MRLLIPTEVKHKCTCLQSITYLPMMLLTALSIYAANREDKTEVANFINLVQNSVLEQAYVNKSKTT